MSALADTVAAEHGFQQRVGPSGVECKCGAVSWAPIGTHGRDLGRIHLVHVAQMTEAAVRAQIAVQAAIPAAALLEAAWDEGNAMGLDGWTGPERGTKPDEHAISSHERTVDRLLGELRARIAEGRRNR